MATHSHDLIATEPSRRIESSAAAMQFAVDEAARLLDADGAFIDLLDPETGMLRWAYAAGITEPAALEQLTDLELAPGTGLFGRAVSERRVVSTPDYCEDPRFVHTEGTDRFARQVGIRSVVGAPLLTEDHAFGVLGVYADRPGAFDERHEGLVRALADHAAARLATHRLIEQLQRSRDQLAHRIEAEAVLRGIAERITVLRDPEELLQKIVDEARRLLGSDGAHLTLRSDDGEYLQPFVMAGIEDEETRAWLREHRLEPGSGTNALAWTSDAPVWTRDYRVDPRLPHGQGYGSAAERMAMLAIAAVPMHGPQQDVIGTLSVSYSEVRDFTDEEIDLLQAFADHAAVAVVNSQLYQRLRDSESRYRLLVEHSPDLVFATDASGRLTYLSDTCEPFTGWRPEELLGKHFSELVDPQSRSDVLMRWGRVVSDPTIQPRVRFLLLRREARSIPVEVHASAVFHDGRFGGMQGAARDLSEFERLEADRRHQAAELAVAQERSHLARELHDSVTQALFSMTLTTRTVEMLLTRGDRDAARARLDELRSLQRDALAEMRALIFALRPGSLEKDGLVQALRTYTEAISQRSALPIDLEAEPLERLPAPVEDAVYRVAQEAIHNIVKHAMATRATVRLWREGDDVHLEVDDDGSGFEPAAVSGGRLGVAGMRARASLIGGQLEIRSERDRGTRVRLVVRIGA